MNRHATICCACVGLLSAVAFGQGAPPSASSGDSTEVSLTAIIVTAERRSEPLQTVPIAVSAFSQDALDAQQLSGGYDLQRAVPNLTFSRVAFGDQNYQIRGVGYQIVAADGEPGVGVAINDAPALVNRLSDAEFYDMAQVEVLRGPQGTLYGRNATGGEINLQTAMPQFDAFRSTLSAQYGNFDAKKLQGSINLPLSSEFAIRIAGSFLKRDGFETDTLTGAGIDGRDLWSGRLTATYKPAENFQATLMYQHFGEDDNRTLGLKQLCYKDPGPTNVGGVPTSPEAQLLLSRGCLPGSVNGPGVFGTPNSVALLAGVLANLTGLQTGDAYAGQTNTGGPFAVQLPNQPLYRVHDDLVQLKLEGDVSEHLTLASLYNFVRDTEFSIDGDGFAANVPFNSTPLSPGGIFSDPQLGASKFLMGAQENNLESDEFSEELRLISKLGGPLEFSVGGIFLKLERQYDIYFFNNGDTYYAQLINSLNPGNPAAQIHIDRNATPTTAGHNYYISNNPYQLESWAGFGEAYYKLTDQLKLTLGYRYTDDHKSAVSIPIELQTAGPGLPSTYQAATFHAPTYRANLSWQATPQNMFYLSYARGWKSGGFNAPDITAVPATYRPETLDSVEIGTKNSFFDHHLTLNLTGFHYNYQNYQIGQINALTAITAITSASIWGAELEALAEPMRNLRFNATAGYLTTRIKGGRELDPFDLTQGNPNLTYLKSPSSACVGNTNGVENLLTAINAGLAPATALIGACPTAAAPNGAYASSYGLVTSGGVPVNLAGRQLPNVPHLTLSLGAEYQFQLAAGWSLRPRGDWNYQSSSFAQVFNSASDILPAWSEGNASLTLDSEPWKARFQAYVKNIANSSVVTTFVQNSSALGLTRGAFYLDPRTYGISVTKSF
jgi:outer membrane receptor protein involved in Fe transport